MRASATAIALLAITFLALAACGGGAARTQPTATAPLVSTSAPAATPTAAARTTGTAEPQAIPTYGYRVVGTFPHDPTAFTQGLVFHDGVLFEGTGLNGRSSLRRVDLATGAVLQRRDLAQAYFGEGITLVGDRIYQLTFRSNTCFVYDRQSFEPLREFTYPTEGWGITYDGSRLFMSDGTSTLYIRDPRTFAETGRIQVRDDQGPVTQLNELEYIDGEIYANIWKADTIVRIDPASGRVTGRIDLSGLLSAEDRSTQQVDVLNGIAFDSATGRLFVTGKLWPKLFAIELVPQG